MISAVVLTKNEEKNIIDCIDSVAFCDEVIVLDDESEDRTREIAKNHGARVYKRSLGRDFASQRNYGLLKAKGDWVLFLDADERISVKLKDEILESINKTEVSGFYLMRKDFMWGKELLHGETSKVKLLRLGRKDAGKWKGKVHETWVVKGKCLLLKSPLFHNPHPTVTDFLREVNFYSSLRAQELEKENVKSTLVDILLYPKVKFFQNYFLRLGFLDGVHGLVAALMMSFHSFLVRSKLYMSKK